MNKAPSELPKLSGIEEKKGASVLPSLSLGETLEDSDIKLDNQCDNCSEDLSDDSSMEIHQNIDRALDVNNDKAIESQPSEQDDERTRLVSNQVQKMVEDKLESGDFDALEDSDLQEDKTTKFEPLSALEEELAVQSADTSDCDALSDLDEAVKTSDYDSLSDMDALDEADIQNMKTSDYHSLSGLDDGSGELAGPRANSSLTDFSGEHASADRLVRSTRVLSSKELKVQIENGMSEFKDIVEKPLPEAVILPDGMEIDGRFKILGLIGKGGFATVYRAHHLSIDRDLALKVMNQMTDFDPSYSERFLREAKLAAKVHHNNVVSIYDFGHIPNTGQPYIAMEMLHGYDLARELKDKGPLSPKRLFSLFRPVIDALGQGHRLGIVHKDLKPENLFIINPHSKHEAMKLLDFGVARICSSELAKLTGHGQMLGTPRYLAPEYIKNQVVSPAIDVYQIALIMSEALTGIPAVSGDAYHAVLMHCSGELQIANFLLDGRIGEVFGKAIAASPDERYPDCEAFGDALDEVADCFCSDVPLCGGEPQQFPRKTASGNLTPMSLSVTRNSGEITRSSSEISAKISRAKAEPVQPKNTEKKRDGNTVAIVILAIALIGVVVFFFVYGKEFFSQGNGAAVPVAATPAVSEYAFSFDTNPPGAQVKINDKFLICTKTPCSYTFKKDWLAIPQEIVFNYDGARVTTSVCISDAEFGAACEFSFEKTQGKVFMEMPKKIDTAHVKLRYQPENAKVFLGSTHVCEKSPCEFRMKCPQGNLKISQEGYQDFVKVSFCSDVLSAVQKAGNPVYEMTAQLNPVPQAAEMADDSNEKKKARRSAARVKRAPVNQKPLEEDRKQGVSESDVNNIYKFMH